MSKPSTTPEPQTSAPQTPEPQTSAPQTPEPQTSAPQTPAPQKASHLTPRALKLLEALILLLGIPAVVVVGNLVHLHSYLTSSLVVTLCLVPFLISFERREIDVRTLVLLAVMSALAVVARCLFFWLPSFKPMAAIIMVAGIAMGARSGFACGAASALASNLMFGQGPWTPWQMIAFGLAGFIAGALASTGAFPRFQLTRKQVIALGITGFVVVVFVVGPVLDTSSVFALLSTLKPASILAIYAAGLPFNVIQGTAVSLALLLVANPLLNMIHRVKIRYDLHLYDEKDKHD